jgi:hypothetical protein
MGIEPTSEAWEASILPLYDARSNGHCTCEMGGGKAARWLPLGNGQDSAAARLGCGFERVLCARAVPANAVSDCAAVVRGILDPCGALL